MSKRRFTSKTYNVPVGTDLPLALNGDYIHVLSATGDFQLSADNDPFSDFPASVGVSVDEFSTISVKNTDSVDITVKILVAYGEVNDNRSSFTGSIATKSGNSIDHGVVSVTDVATQIVAADSTRTRLEIQNHHATEKLYYGAATVSTSNTAYIEAGQSRFFETGAAIYTIFPIGKSGNVAYVSEGE